MAQRESDYQHIIRVELEPPQLLLDFVSVTADQDHVDSGIDHDEYAHDLLPLSSTTGNQVGGRNIHSQSNKDCPLLAETTIAEDDDDDATVLPVQSSVCTVLKIFSVIITVVIFIILGLTVALYQKQYDQNKIPPDPTKSMVTEIPSHLPKELEPMNKTDTNDLRHCCIANSTKDLVYKCQFGMFTSSMHTDCLELLKCDRPLPVPAFLHCDHALCNNNIGTSTKLYEPVCQKTTADKKDLQHCCISNATNNLVYRCQFGKFTTDCLEVLKCDHPLPIPPFLHCDNALCSYISLKTTKYYEPICMP